MIRVGTCSWTERTLIQSGEFYPREIKTAEARLRYYSSLFDTVEVDSSYYAIPDKRTTSLWVERTPDNFIFHIKVYGALTGHGTNPRTLPRDIFDDLPEREKTEKYIYAKNPSLLSAIAERFREALTPLVRAHKLGLLVFQFPPWFRWGRNNLDHILICRDMMQGFRVGVEFRHGSWLAPDTRGTVFDFLRENGITYVTADEPQYGNFATVPFVPYLTSETAYFRFHGRNKENWLKRGDETSLRYNYLYSEEELKKFLTHITAVGKRTKITYAMFNNCYGSFAMKNALRIKELAKERT